jgi:hypothetical protein
MRLTLVMLVLSLAASAYSGKAEHRVVQDEKAKPQQEQGTTEPQKEANSTDGSGPMPHAQDGTKKTSDARQEPDDRVYRVKIEPQPTDLLYIASIIISGLAVLVGVGTLLIVWRQTGSIRKAAEAAQLNAQAIINAERPWVMPELENTILVPGLRQSSKDGTLKVVTPPETEFRLWIKNEGRTPAHILSVIAKSVFTNRGEDLPDIPNYGEHGFFDQQRILSPNSARMSLDQWSFRQRTALLDEWENVIENPVKWWWWYGRIQYRDVLDGKDHETRFCYLYMIDRDAFVIAGPREYTKYT